MALKTRMVLEPSEIMLTKVTRSTTINLSNSAGSEKIAWVAYAADPGLLTVTPQTGDGGKITIAVTGTLDFYGSVQSAVYVFDITGPDKPVQTIAITIKGDQPHMPGDTNGDTQKDLADVILNLQIATGLTPLLPGYPEPRGSDVDSDFRLGATEAIYVLQESSDIR